MISVDLSQPRYIIGYIIYELLDFEDFHEVEKQPFINPGISTTD